MNSTCRPATSHFFLVKLCYAPPGSWLQCCSAAHTCLRMRMRLQELDWPWDSRKAVTLSRRGVTPQIAKEYRDMRSTQVSVSSWWKVSSACRWSDSCSEYCCCCPRSDSTDFLLHHEVGLFKLLLNINSKILNLHATKSFLWVSLHLRNHMMMTWRARETV